MQVNSSLVIVSRRNFWYLLWHCVMVCMLYKEAYLSPCSVTCVTNATRQSGTSVPIKPVPMSLLTCSNASCVTRDSLVKVNYISTLVRNIPNNLKPSCEYFTGIIHTTSKF